jgi:hypothetical protein
MLSIPSLKDLNFSVAFFILFQNQFFPTQTQASFSISKSRNPKYQIKILRTTSHGT